MIIDSLKYIKHNMKTVSFYLQSMTRITSPLNLSAVGIRVDQCKQH